MTTTTTEAPARPGRQRSEAADQAIVAATIEVLTDEGYAGLTMAAVIARSGVSSATLYRRWATKQELVAAALASLHPEIVDPDTGSLEGDLIAFLHHLADAMVVRRADLAADLGAEMRRNPDFAHAVKDKFLRPRVEAVEQIITRAVARGELATFVDAEAATSLITGPLHHQVHVVDRPAGTAFLSASAVAAMAALRALAA